MNNRTLLTDITRRDSLRIAGTAILGAALTSLGGNAMETGSAMGCPGEGQTPEPPAKLDLSVVLKKYAAAHRFLKDNIRKTRFCSRPVLTSGVGIGKPTHAGAAWLETSVLESLLYTKHDPEVALGTHELFFNTQREDGLIPAIVDTNEFRRSWWGDKFIVFGHVQQNVPIARTAWELTKLTKDERFLAKAYDCCAKFDRWIVKYRNTRGTGLAEMFCEYDMGLDWSPRCHGPGIPAFCPEHDATKYRVVDGFPLAAPDMSAVVYGARLALAQMAEALDKPAEARRWNEQAAELKSLIIKRCFDPQDEFFYDVNMDGTWRKIRGTQLFPLAQEHVLDQKLFDRLYSRYIRNPKEYWTTVPFPSISVSDPRFDPKPRSDWSGSAVVTLATRALLWMPYYGKQEDLKDLMRRWIAAWLREDKFEACLHPVTGRGYPKDMWSNQTCTCLPFIEFADRLGLLAGTGKQNAMPLQIAHMIENTTPDTGNPSLRSQA